MTTCEALLKTIPKDIADRQWVIEAVKILRKHDRLQERQRLLEKDNREMGAVLDSMP